MQNKDAMLCLHFEFVCRGHAAGVKALASACAPRGGWQPANKWTGSEACCCVHAAGAPLLVGEWGGCCYVLRPDLVLARGASAEQGPRLAAFDVDARTGGGRTATCRWAAPAEAAVRVSRRLSVLARLCHAASCGSLGSHAAAAAGTLLLLLLL